jgi:hypothetical protein
MNVQDAITIKTIYERKNKEAVKRFCKVCDRTTDREDCENCWVKAQMKR